MPINIQMLPHLPLKSLRQNGNQYYVDANGTRLPSVTAILKATQPQAERDRLIKWRQRIGAEQANQISTTASRRGTQTHKFIQRYLQGEDPLSFDTTLPYWRSIEPVLQNIDIVRLVESPIVHYDLNYAGRVDCVASYKGIPCVCEWKTAERPKGTIKRLFDASLQLSAYLGAVNYSYQDYRINIDHALLVVALPDSPAEVFWFEKAKIDAYWQQWEKRVAAYWQRQGINP